MTDKITVSRWRDQAPTPLLLACHPRTEAEKRAAVSTVGNRRRATGPRCSTR